MALGDGLSLVFPTDDVGGAGPSFDFLLQENGDLLLQEDGDKIIIT